MTGKSHAAANAFLSYALFLDPTITVMALLGSRTPDAVEKFLPFVKHRGLSHVMIFWAAAACFLFQFQHSEMMFGFVLGGLLHIVMDGCSETGVPIFRTTGRFRMRYYKTGRLSEIVFLLIICTLAGIIACARKGLIIRSITHG